MIVFSVIVVIWLVLAQCSLKFRISDAQAKKKFDGAGVNLNTGKIVVDGFDIHYAKTGNDTLPTLFFVHGSPGGWNAFEKFMHDKDLLSKYRMVSVDRPGFGYSMFGDAKNLEEQSKLIYLLLVSLQNNKPVYALGHSLGGPVIIRMQADYEDLFAGLILLAASVDPGEEKPEKWRLVLYKTPLKFFLPGAFRPSNEELWYLKNDLKKLDGEWDKIKCPVWIIHGDKDRMVPLNNADYARKKLINAGKVEVKILPGAGHFIPWSKYGEIKEVLMRLPG